MKHTFFISFPPGYKNTGIVEKNKRIYKEKKNVFVIVKVFFLRGSFFFIYFKTLSASKSQFFFLFNRLREKKNESKIE